MGTLSKKISDCVFYGILDTGYVKPESLFDKCQSIARRRPHAEKHSLRAAADF